MTASLHKRPGGISCLLNLPDVRRASKAIRESRPFRVVRPDLDQAPNVKRLANHRYGYRLRVGTYRVFFEFDGAVRMVTIEEAKKRNEQTH
jgi:mRNA-degrading endonuclease RelE of RelBE toxin-antitoxin system